VNTAKKISVEQLPFQVAFTASFFAIKSYLEGHKCQVIILMPLPPDTVSEGNVFWLSICCVCSFVHQDR